MKVLRGNLRSDDWLFDWSPFIIKFKFEFKFKFKSESFLWKYNFQFPIFNLQLHWLNLFAGFILGASPFPIIVVVVISQFKILSISLIWWFLAKSPCVGQESVHRNVSDRIFFFRQTAIVSNHSSAIICTGNRFIPFIHLLLLSKNFFRKILINL